MATRLQSNRPECFLFTVDVEEWFHTKWFSLEKIGYATRSPPRTSVLESVKKICMMLSKYRIPGTFFVLAETYLRYPSVIDTILDGGRNEVGIHGYSHRGIFELGVGGFRDEISSAKRLLEDATGGEIVGYRAPNFSYNMTAAMALTDMGFSYDSSLNPCIRIPGWYGYPTIPTSPFRVGPDNNCKGTFTEIPSSVFPLLRLPGNGGWFLRNIGIMYVKTLLEMSASANGYSMFYIHPWEFSEERPTLPATQFHVFRNCGTRTQEWTELILKSANERMRFLTVSQYLGQREMAS